MNDPSIEKNLHYIRNILLAFLFIALLFIFKALTSILMPLILAALLAMLFLPVILFLKKLRIPLWLIVPLIALFTFFVLFQIGQILSNTVQELLHQQDFFYHQFQIRLEETLIILKNNLPSFEIDVQEVKTMVNELYNRDNVANLVGTVARTAGSFGSSVVIFAIYYVLLLAGVSHYREYFYFVGGNRNHLVDTVVVLQKTISTYIGIKTIISLVTGIIAGLVCTLFGIKFALFWGFLTFILNFIPSIGSIIATMPPVFMAFIQFDSLSHVFLILFILTGIQLTIGNFLDPMIMGDRLRLNTVTVIFGLLFWGYIWGIPGMLISVPLMVIIKVVLEKSSAWSIVSRAMASADWNPYRLRPFFLKKMKDTAPSKKPPADE